MTQDGTPYIYEFDHTPNEFSKLEVIDDPESVSTFLDALPTAISHKAELFKKLC